MDQLHSTTITPDRERGQHLKFEDRCSIKIFRKLGYSLRAIVAIINCSPSTVMYELRRGTGNRKSNVGRPPEYSAKRGQANYEINRSRCHRPHKLNTQNPFIDWMVRQFREQHWSLDACVGYARKNQLFPKEQIVPTVKQDYLRNRMTLQGYVHDEIAAFMGGVSGNAGLFSNARDVAKVYQMLINGGMYGGKRYLSLETCNLFMTKTSRISRRGLGFDKPDRLNPTKGPCAEEAPAEVVGHTGFTGTCAWADPKNGLVFVFLSNRIYPRPFDHKALMSLNIRPRIQQVMYQALRK